ncbi:MAG TPA: DUF2270 domain-containing protein [Pyrinomonadaceae bacterium]|nr:DUF2270 domain-containing protein [Pyrinomonadaceae bacterium]
MKTDLRPRNVEQSTTASKTLQAARPAPPSDSPETAPIHQTITPEQAAIAAQSPRAPRRTPAPSEFGTAVVHFYRGEIQRANTWRNRLDTTTNWAVLTTGATLSFAFSSPANPHFVILINTVLVGFFLFMEARRYRYYEIWSSRVRLVETGYFTQILAPDSATDDSWTRLIIEDLKTPRFTISEWEALGRRLRHNYLWIFVLLAACWNLKIYMHPGPAKDVNEFIDRATIGVVPGVIIFLVGVFVNTVILVFAAATMRLRQATGEVLPERDFHPFQRVTNWASGRASKPRTATVRRAARARERARSTRAAGTTTGEWRRSDIHRSQPPEDIHRTQYPNRDTVIK